MRPQLRAITLLFIITATLFGCNVNDPKPVAQKFLIAIYGMDYATAKTVATEQTKSNVEAWEELMSQMQQNGKEEAKKIKVNIKDSKLENDSTAIVQYNISIDSTVKSLKLVKQNGKWLAQWTKMEAQIGTGMNMDVPTGDMHPGSVMPANDTNTIPAPAADGTEVPKDTLHQ